MLTLEEWMDVRLLQAQGLSQREIARRTGYSRNTVARLLRQAAPQPYRRPPRGSQLDPYKPYLRERCQAGALSGVRLLEELRPLGYTGSIDVLRRFLQTLRGVERAHTKATVRFETPAGQQGQVDWGYCGAFPDAHGQPVKIYAFVMVRGFSRMLFVQFTTSMDLPQLLACHLEAFTFFGGWPRELLYDNMAQVKQPGSADWNPLFLDFAHHHGFIPKTCRVRRPRTKGKVERAIGYVKQNFLAGRAFADLAELNAQGRHWLDHTANVRIHATTGRRPVDLHPAEGLLPLVPERRYQLAQRHVRRVSAEGFVHLEGSRYSVLPEHVGKEVLVEVGEQRVKIRAGDLILAEHPKAAKPGACMVQPEHAAAFWKLCLPPSSGRAGEPQEPPRRSWEVTFSEAVATTPLTAYAELEHGTVAARPMEVVA